MRFLRDRGGILTDEDFRSYRPQLVEAVSATCRGFDLYTPPPPSGGITSLGIVQTVERLLEAGSREQGARSIEPWGAQYFHLLAEATMICWHERHQHFGDPDFVSISLEQFVGDQAAEARAEQIKHRQTGIPTSHSPLPAPRSDSPHTANVIAIDAEGNSSRLPPRKVGCTVHTWLSMAWA